MLLMVLGFLVLLAPAANAAVVDVNTVPDNLREYIPGTPEWDASPWMTASDCRDSGGDWSIYTQNVINDTPALLQFFQPDFGGQDAAGQARGQEILAGYRDIAAQIRVPAGYCVNEAKQWAGADPAYKPFGFDWGNATNSPHHTDFGCHNNVGADNAPCGGFYVGCGGATTQQAQQLCQAWNAFSDGYVHRVNAARGKAIDDNPATGQGKTDTVYESPFQWMQGVFDWTVQHGMQQVTSFIIDGVTKLWAIFLQVAVKYSAPNITGTGFADVYNLVAGVALAIAFLGWLVTLASSWKQGRLQFALFGGIKAAVGVTLAGVGAILMLQLADDCTTSLAQAGGDLAHQADFTTSLAKANPLVAVVVGLLIAIFLVFATIFMVIHGALVLMWALMGSVAAAGQVHPASSGWLVKWGSRLAALAWSKFAMVAVMLLSQALLLPLDAGEDTVKQIVDVVQGLALAFLLVTTPYLLWELVDFVGDRAGGGAASGGPASSMAGAGAGRVASAAGSAAGNLAGATGNAVNTMMASVADLGRQFSGGSTGGDGGKSGSGAGTPPRANNSPPTSGEKDSKSEPGTGEGRSSGQGGSARPPSGSSGAADGPPANRGKVYSGSPMIPDLSPGASKGGGSGGAGGAGAAGGAKPPPVPPV